MRRFFIYLQSEPTFIALRRIVLYAFALAFPLFIKAQDGRFEFNAGISTPGYYALADWDFNDPVVKRKWSDGILNNLTDESYNSTLYPSLSVEIAYRLSDSGILGHLSLVGMASYHKVVYEHRNIVDVFSDKQTAIKADVLLGVRVNVVQTTHLTLYSQAMAGTDFKNSSDYWTISNEILNDGYKPFVYQITFAGFRVKLGHRTSHFAVMTELGYGSEYVMSKEMLLLPGIRAGLSYRL